MNLGDKMVSLMFYLCILFAFFSFLITFLMYMENENGNIFQFPGLFGLFLIFLVIVGSFDHPKQQYKITEERVVILNNKAISESCLNLNEELGVNLKDGDIVYKIEYLPYWHRGFYWFKDGKTFTFSKEDPRKSEEQ